MVEAGERGASGRKQVEFDEDDEPEEDDFGDAEAAASVRRCTDGPECVATLVTEEGRSPFEDLAPLSCLEALRLVYGRGPSKSGPCFQKVAAFFTRARVP